MNTGSGPNATSEDFQGDDFIVSLRDVFAVLWRRWWVILLAALLCAGAAYAYSATRTPLYSGSIKLLIGQKAVEGAPASLGSDVTGLQQITQTMAQAVATRPVAEAAAEELGPETTPEAVRGGLVATQVETTQFIQVSYTNPDPKKASQVANAVGEAFSDQVSRVSPGASSVTATVWERAVTPVTPISPKPERNALLGLMLGLMLGLGLAFLIEYLDDRWRSPEEVEKVSGVPTFGVIPQFKPPKVKKGGA